MIRFWQELKRRNVFKAAIAYLVASWLILQVLSIVLPSLEAPDWVMRVLMVLLTIGFPIWLIFSWVYELTPEGLKKSDDIEEHVSITAQTNRRLNVLILVALLAVILVILFKPNVDLFKTSKGKYAIAVLYFDNMSEDEENEWISESMTESILTKLMPNKQLLVISRTSVKQFVDTNEPVSEIAKKLGVSFILEGSVTIHEDRARITAQLVDRNDHHIWADEYNVKIENILMLQDEISKSIVDKLNIVLSPEEKEQLKYNYTNNIEAFKLYQKGRTFADERSEKGLERSIIFFNKAFELDSSFSEALAEIAMSYYLMGEYGYIQKEESVSNANFYIEKAFEINPKTVTAFTVKGNILTDEENWETAKEFYEKAISMNPNDVSAHHFFGGHFYQLAHRDSINFLKHANIAQQLDPLSKPVNYNVLWALIANDKLDEAEKHINKMGFLFGDGDKYLKRFILRQRAENLSLEKKDLTESIKFYEDKLKKQPENHVISNELAQAYNGILNDNRNYLKYAKKTYESDSTHISYIIYYFKALLEEGKFTQADLFMKRDNYIRVLSKFSNGLNLWYYHYFKGDYIKSQEVLTDTIFNEAYRYKLLNFAQIGEIKQIHQIFQQNKINNTDKAFVYAVLKQRDSMYHYLNQDAIHYMRVNGSFEFDPYRKEEQYIAFLKKHYLPITNWNK